MEKILAGINSLFGKLKECGYNVHPVDLVDGEEHTSYSGGFTVRRYSGFVSYGLGNLKHTIDAIQIESGFDFRRVVGSDLFETFGKDMGESIINFYKNYRAL